MSLQKITITSALTITLFLGGCQRGLSQKINQPVNSNVATTTSSIGTPVATSTSDIDTSDWKTYRNEEYGIEIRYPAGWVFSDIPNGEYDENLLIFQSYNSYISNKSSSDKPGFYVLPGGGFGYGLPSLISQEDVSVNGARYIRATYQNFEIIKLTDSIPGYSKFFRIEIHYGANTDSESRKTLENIFKSIRLINFK